MIKVIEEGTFAMLVSPEFQVVTIRNTVTAGCTKLILEKPTPRHAFHGVAFATRVHLAG